MSKKFLSALLYLYRGKTNNIMEQFLVITHWAFINENFVVDEKSPEV